VPLRDYRRIFPSLRNCGLTEVRLAGPDREAALLEFNTPIERVITVQENS
jgi:probable phosphoglycerate mutase